MQALFHFWSNIIYQLVNKGKPVNTLCTRHIMIQFSIFRTEPSNALNRTQQHFCRNYCARADKLLQGTLRIKFQENLTKRTRVLWTPFLSKDIITLSCDDFLAKLWQCWWNSSQVVLLDGVKKRATMRAHIWVWSRGRRLWKLKLWTSTKGSLEIAPLELWARRCFLEITRNLLPGVSCPPSAPGRLREKAAAAHCSWQYRAFAVCTAWRCMIVGTARIRSTVCSASRASSQVTPSTRVCLAPPRIKQAASRGSHQCRPGPTWWR